MMYDFKATPDKGTAGGCRPAYVRAFPPPEMDAGIGNLRGEACDEGFPRKPELVELIAPPAPPRLP